MKFRHKFINKKYLSSSVRLKEKSILLQKENNELKNREEDIDYHINEAKTKNKGLEDYLEDKIREETQLRQYYEISGWWIT